MKSGTMIFSSSDPKRWQSDQKRYLRELERVTNEQKEAIQKIQSSEHRAKTELKAYETQASELRQQQTTFMQAQPTNTQPTGRHYSRNSRSRGVQYTKVFLQPMPNQFSEPNSSLAESSKRDTTQNDRSEDPMPYTSPLSPHAPMNQRQVTGSERNQSPNNRGSPLVPSPQPADSHYSVPIPATMDRVTPSPTTQGNVRTPHHGVDSARNQQYHTPALVPNSRPVLETAANGANSPTVYDQPRPQTIPSTHPSSVS